MPAGDEIGQHPSPSLSSQRDGRTTTVDGPCSCRVGFSASSHLTTMPFLVALLLLFLGACHATPAPTATPAKIAGQWSGQHGARENAVNLVVRDRAAWEALWRDIGREPPQAFDPSHETAVAIFLGQRRTGGYSVEILGLRRENDDLVLDYREQKPAPDAMVTQVISSPWAVVLLSPSGLPIEVRPQPSSPP